MLYEALSTWAQGNKNTKYHLIFHTSVLNFGYKDLRDVFLNLNYDWILPRNVFYEIKHLIKSKTYGKKARLFLALWYKKSGGLRLRNTLEDFYENNDKLNGAFLNSSTEKFIFVIQNKLKLREFLNFIFIQNNYYVLYHESWDVINQSQQNAGVMHVSEASYYSYNEKKRVQRKGMNGGQLTSEALGIIENTTLIGCKTSIGYTISKMVQGGANGGESYIYEIRNQPELLLKVFKYSPSSYKKEKIDIISSCDIEGVVVPIEAVRLQKQIVGIVMKKVIGNRFQKTYVQDIHLDLFETIALQILELNMRNVVWVDLSEDNIMTDKSGEHPSIIDTDSFQVKDYPAGVEIKKSYRHKDLMNIPNNFLYYYMYQDFAFSVLLFKYLVCADNSPLRTMETKEGLKDFDLIWGKDVFPYDLALTNYRHVDINAFGNWKNTLNNHFRKQFYDIFTFKKTCSMGCWIELFETKFLS